MIKEDVIQQLEDLKRDIDKGFCKRIDTIITNINLNMISIDQLSLKPNILSNYTKDLGPKWFELPISIRLKNCLKELCYDLDYHKDLRDSFPMLIGLDVENYRLGHFESVAPKDLLKLRNFGMKSLKEVEQTMLHYGYHLFS